MYKSAKFSIGAVTRFYIPLMLQGFSQSLTYPLVAGIVTHGHLGVNALTAFSQGLMIMFMIGSIGGGLITTGMVFAKTRYGYLSFVRLNTLMMIALLLLQCLPAMSPFCDWIFGGFFALPPELADVSRQMLLAGVIMNAGFFLRNVPMVVLFNNYQSGKANNATLARIALTLACSLVFPRLGLNGPGWGMTALTLGVLLELLITWLYARPLIRSLLESGTATPPGREVVALTFEQFRFTMPLALGGFLLATSPLVIAAFVARSCDAAAMLTIHYVTMGVANPVAFAALRLQPVAVKFPPEYRGDVRLLKYAIVSGLILGLVPLLFATEAVGNRYFGGYQNVPAEILPTVRMVIAIYAVLPIIQAVRARIEGIAAVRKRPSAVMAGQITYTISLFVVCAVLMLLAIDGWRMAVSAIIIAPMCTAAAIYINFLFQLKSKRKLRRYENPNNWR